MANKEVIGDLVTKISMESNDFNDGVKKLNRQMRVVKSEFAVAKQRLKDFGDGTKYLEAQSESLSDQLTIHQAKVKTLEQAYEEAKESTGDTSYQTQNLSVKLNNARAAMAKTEKQLDNVNEELREQNGLVKRNGGLWGRYAGDIKKAVKNSEHELEGLRHAMIGLGVGAGVGIGAAVYQAATFEQALANVQAVTGSTDKQIQQLSKQAKELGEQTKYSGRQVVEAAGELVKAGLSMDEVLGGALQGSLNLATAGELRLADAAEIASTALNAFEEDNLSVSDAADILAGAANASATSVQEMRVGLAQSSAAAANAGFSFKETSTALAVLANNGLKGSDAGTSLRTMLLRLAPTTKTAKEKMQELGIITKENGNRFYDAQGNVKDFSGVVGVLRDALDDLNPRERQKALKEMFGTDAYRAGAIFFKEAADGVNEMADAMERVSAAEVAAERMDTFLGKVDELVSSLQTAGIEIGDEFLPMLTDVVKEITEMTRSISDMNPAVIAVGLKAAGAAAGFGVLATSIVKVSRGLMLLRANPIGLAITGLTLLVGAVVGAKEAYDEFQKVNLDTANKMQKTYMTTKDQIDQFDQLRKKSKLTSDEFARYIDLQEKVNEATDPQKIKSYKNKMKDLQKESGLSNKELDTMVGLNKDLVKKLPKSSTKISEQGNRIAGTTKELKKYNDELAKKTMRELETQALKLVQKESQLKAKINEYQNKYNQGVKIEKQIRTVINGATEKNRQKLKDMYLTQYKKNGLTDGERQLLAAINKRIDRGGSALQNMLVKQKKTNDETQEQIDKRQKELNKLKLIRNRMNKIAFEQSGINYKHGRGLKWLNRKINALKRERDQIIKNAGGVDSLNAKQQTQINKIDRQISKYNTARGKVVGINRLLGKNIPKDVNVDANTSSYDRTVAQIINEPMFSTVHMDPDASEYDSFIERNIRQTLYQPIKFYSAGGPGAGNNADGTDNWRGGLTWVGEEGPELMNLPRGTQIFSNDKSMEIMRQMRQMGTLTAKQTGGGSVSPAAQPAQPQTVQVQMPVPQRAVFEIGGYQAEGLIRFFTEQQEEQKYTDSWNEGDV
ncbi:phage tail tape measure protein [Tuberibacillus sp. Marseille-P3662]|uniref:phage tail tape measure protein n=1 Tax=Tuberibacillus sp. Marseille-P3662 TaxID=1965358 RepID=UPI000A1CC2B9|nr:phage tail tape measure protein [Tuberibacillus sp. Marseille-P3662]